MVASLGCPGLGRRLGSAGGHRYLLSHYLLRHHWFDHGLIDGSLLGLNQIRLIPQELFILRSGIVHRLFEVSLAVTFVQVILVAGQCGISLRLSDFFLFGNERFRPAGPCDSKRGREWSKERQQDEEVEYESRSKCAHMLE